MKTSLIIVCLALLSFCTVTAQNPGDNIFAGTQVHTINIRFPQARYWDSLTFYYEQGDEQYIPATVIIDGVQYNNVGVRLKGNSSYSHPNNKKSFRFSFDEYVDDQRWDGVKGIHLNNSFSDPTFMREKTYLDFCRDAGIPAPRANFAQVSINDSLFAFYSLVEHVDKRFLGARFGNKDGNLFKAVDAFGGGGGQTQVISDFKWYGKEASSYSDRYEFKTDESTTGWSQMIAFLDTLNNSASIATSLPQQMDMTMFYRAMATDLLFASLDSYIGSGRNFYVYFDQSTGKLKWIIWDTNMSFGGYPQSGSSPETMSVTYVSSSANRPLVGKVFGSPALKKEYLQTLCQLSETYFSASRISARIDSVAAIIRPYVYADQRKMYTNAQFETNITSDITESRGGGGGRSRKPGLKSFLTARAASVRSQLGTLGISCDVTADPAASVVINEFSADNETLADPAGEFEDWIELYNPTDKSIDLSGRHLSDTYAQPGKWQFPANTTIPAGGYLMVWADEDSAQAGLHAAFKLSAGGEQIVLSGSDLSLIDSVSFGAQTTDRSMARIPNGTGPFVRNAPTPGAMNVLASSISGVVINEFGADNSTIADPAGEFGAWIELYNTTDQPVDLEGAYLSNAFAQSAMWKFPAGATIGAGGYLIVWADGDSAQSGLHTNFQLSAGGGQIILSGSGMELADSVRFGAQSKDRSMARIPNGTGPFVPAAPTFNAMNVAAPAFVGVVINEFAADNDTIADPSEEYDDWIELYNTTDSSIDLGGMYLSDSYAQPMKWQFPAGTSIGAGSYLIVWADEGLTQNGVHAGFKLSAGGEQLILSGSDLSIIDSVSFGAQTTNLSMARVPNGTGPFVQGPPTFGVSNDAVIAAVTQAGSGIAGEGVMLGENHPNPFAAATTFEIRVIRAGAVSLTVHDMLGRPVATILERELPAGTYQMRWEPGDVPAGVYFYTIRSGASSRTRQMILER